MVGINKSFTKTQLLIQLRYTQSSIQLLKWRLLCKLLPSPRIDLDSHIKCEDY